MHPRAPKLLEDIHNYDVIDPAIVLSTIEVDLAPLLTDVQALLSSVG